MDLNKAMVIGRLTRDPESRNIPSGAQVTNFSIATNSSWGGGDGEDRKERVEYHNIVAWGKLAEICSNYLKKGSKVYIEGRLQTQSWEAQDGGKRSKTEIVAREMIMLDSKGGSDSSRDSFDQGAASAKSNSGAQGGASSAPAKEEEETIKLEDIPF